MQNGATEYLALADWRRQIACLYADVRRMAESDPEAAWNRWRLARERLFREHPRSPLPLDARPSFRARHFGYDRGLRFVLPVRSAHGSDGGIGAVDVPTSAGTASTFQRIGWVEIPFPAGARRLAIFWLPEYSGGLFLSFRDGTNGVETYGGGRYLLDGAKSADLGGSMAGDDLILDFNFSFQPSCAFDPQWRCPLVPPENRLDVRIAAGERLE